MGLFGKKKEKKIPCDCGGMCTPSEIEAKKVADEAAAAAKESTGAC